MDHNQQEQIALHRWAVIAEAAGDKLTARERGALVRQIAARASPHPDGSSRTYSRGSIDRWLRAWRRAGWRRSSPRSERIPGWCVPTRSCSPRPRRCGWSCPAAQPRRSLRSCITGTGSRSRSGRSAASCAGPGCTARRWPPEPKAYGRYEAARPNERWISDALAGPWVPWPRRDGSVRARLFLIVDDHSRLPADGRFYGRENARACQDLLRRAITRRGLPQVFYADNGAPFSNAWLARTCGVLGIRLVHSKPYSPEGRGKQERLNRYIREAFLAEAVHQGIESLDALNDLFAAWAEQVANRRVHAETGQTPIGRFEAGGPRRQADPALIREAFRWSVTRRVTRTATVPLEGNAYAVDPALAGLWLSCGSPRPDPDRGLPGRQARRGRGPVRHPPPRAPGRAAGRTPSRTPPRLELNRSPGRSGQQDPRPRRNQSPRNPSRELRSPRLPDLAPLMTGAPPDSMSCKPALMRPHAVSTRSRPSLPLAVSTSCGSHRKHRPSRKLSGRLIRLMKWSGRESGHARINRAD